MGAVGLEPTTTSLTGYLIKLLQEILQTSQFYALYQLSYAPITRPVGAVHFNSMWPCFTRIFASAGSKPLSQELLQNACAHKICSCWQPLLFSIMYTPVIVAQIASLTGDPWFPSYRSGGRRTDVDDRWYAHTSYISAFASRVFILCYGELSRP